MLRGSEQKSSYAANGVLTDKSSKTKEDKMQPSLKKSLKYSRNKSIIREFAEKIPFSFVKTRSQNRVRFEDEIKDNKKQAIKCIQELALIDS